MYTYSTSAIMRMTHIIQLCTMTLSYTLHIQGYEDPDADVMAKVGSFFSSMFGKKKGGDNEANNNSDKSKK